MVSPRKPLLRSGAPCNNAISLTPIGTTGREALQKLNRKANEGQSSFGTEKVN